MKDLEVISTEETGNIEWNFEELKQQLQKSISGYTALVYTEDSIKNAKDDRANLNRLKKSIEEKLKGIKKIYMAPYSIVEEQAKELMKIIDEPAKDIDKSIKIFEEREKEAKRKIIREYFNLQSKCLGNLAEMIFSNLLFYNSSWENKSTPVSKHQDEIDKRIAEIATDIKSIQKSGGPEVIALLEEYCTSLSMKKVYEKKTKLDEIRMKCNGEEEFPEYIDATEEGYKVLKISGTEHQMLQILDYMNMLGINVEELENGMPKKMDELETPDFDSFVAFDIETTGTYGKENGDAPAEITEIGAVKVVNGNIVGRFSELANPRRKIVPKIAELTGITDEMVEDKPPISEIIKRFKEFVGDNILLGHNIKSFDIPHISRAAKNAGIAFYNAYFDTYRCANTLKEAQGWDNVKLTYLAERFGIEQKDAHRAWCDAETNVGVYFGLKASI